MCSIYNYIHLHIHKCIHIELPCLFVVVFAQQNKLSKNCRKGHLIRIFWTAASRFLSAPHPLLRRLVNACGLVFCRWTSSEFSFWKKKGTKKGQCLFFAGGKRKKRARRRERILEVQVSEVETCCVQVESRKKMTLTFLQKKKPSRFAQCGNLWFRLTPPSKHLSFWRENGPSGSRLGYWQLSRTSVKSKIMLEAFSGAPMVFLEIPIFGRRLLQKKHTTTIKKGQAIHLFGDSTEKIAPISSLPAVKNFWGCGTTSRVLKDDFVMGWVPCMPCCALFWCLVFLRKIPWSSVEIVAFVGWSSNYTSVAKWTWFFGPRSRWQTSQVSNRTPVLFGKNRGFLDLFSFFVAVFL